MPKHTIRDILPPDNRPPKRRPVNQPPFMEGGEHKGEPERPVSTQPAVDGLRTGGRFGKTRFGKTEFNRGGRPGMKSKMKLVYIAVGAILGILLLSFLFSLFFGGAGLTVHPKQETITVNGDFTAKKKPASGELGFQTMTLESMLTKTVPATGSEEVEEKASGQIVIYNDYNDSPQRLIRNTRFETPEGLIYRIDKSVIVPGQTKEDGKTVPGSIEVTVYADEPGENYNIGLTDFTIPGFKGAPQFEHFYAKSKTAMAGGFIGKRLVVDDSVLETERAALHQKLRADLEGQVASQEPEGFISFDDGVFIQFISETPAEKGDEVEIREKAVLYNILFKEDALAHFLAENTLGDFDGSDVTFIDASGLTLTAQSPENEESAQPWEGDTFSFSMSGNATIVWLFDEAKLKQDLSGRNKEAIHTILSGYPGIDEAEVVIRPFWKRSFPTNVDEIKIETVIAGKE